MVEHSEHKRASSSGEREVRGGISPWLAHAQGSQRDTHNPYIVGFYQDDKGEVQTLFGERYFRSERQIVESLFAGRVNRKEVNLLLGQFQHVESPVIRKSKYWEALPEDLQQRFTQGEVLVTSEVDAYSSDHTKSEYSPEEYYLLYYSDYNSDKTGRTGVLMHSLDGQLAPVKVVIDGKEYVIEIKGCGKKSGGFGAIHYRTGRDIITGGAEGEQARNEIARLEENNEDGTPKAIGYITFDNNGYDQGYILRLTPSTVRASYKGNDVYPEIDTPENARSVIEMYAKELHAQIFAPNPKILDRSSHTENLLVWGNGQYTFTDFSDHVAFNDRNYPHDESQGGGYMTPKQMLYYYIEMVREIPGYNETADKEYFYDTLSEAFIQKGKSLGLASSDTVEEATQKVWEQGGMAYQVFNARREGGYVPEGALKELKEKTTRSSNDLALHSETAFAEKYIKSVDDMQETINIIRSQPTDEKVAQSLDRAYEMVSVGDLLSDFDTINNVWELYLRANIHDQFNDQVSQVFLYIAALMNAISPIKDYLDHELDVVSSAKVNAPLHEAGTLEKAEHEVQERKDLFTQTVRSPKGLFQLLTNQDKAKDTVTFSFYTSKETK